MIYLQHYEYELKLKKHRDQEDLRNFTSDIEKGIDNNFQNNIVPNSIKVNEKYFAFDLKKPSINNDLKTMGVEIAKLSTYLDSIKITYNKSTQIFVRRTHF